MENEVIEETKFKIKSKEEEVEDINIINIIVHYLDKDGDSAPRFRLSEECLPISYLSKKFIKKVKEKHYKRNPIYGTFDKDDIKYPFQTLAKNYINKEDNFIEFTENSMNLLKNNIENTQGTGGYILFAHYKITQGEFLCVIMLHNTTGFNINLSLQLEELNNLDIDNLDIANFININKWRNCEEDDSYLSFLDGRKKITEYFKRFIGCTNQKSATIASKHFYTALYEFLETKNFNKTQKNEIKNNIFEYCSTQIKNKEDIRIDTISAMISPDNVDEFKKFACNETYQVSSVFRGNNSVIKNLKFINFKSDDLSINFSRELLRNDTIIFDEERQTLTINKIPTELNNLLNNRE